MILLLNTFVDININVSWKCFYFGNKNLTQHKLIHQSKYKIISSHNRHEKYIINLQISF